MIACCQIENIDAGSLYGSQSSTAWMADAATPLLARPVTFGFPTTRPSWASSTRTVTEPVAPAGAFQQRAT